jgi:hypothetical protein
MYDACKLSGVCIESIATLLLLSLRHINPKVISQ